MEKIEKICVFPCFGKRLCVWPRFKVENGENVDFMYFVVFVGFGEKVENGENRENPCFSLFLAKDFVSGRDLR